MSTDIGLSKSHKKESHKKHKRHKDRAEKKSSKKRRYEGDNQEQEASDAEKEPQSSFPKKRRTEENQANNDTTNDILSVIQSKAGLTTTTSLTTISPFSIESTSLYVPVPPISLGDPIPGVCAEHLSPLLLTFYPPVSGVVLAYSDVTLSESSGLSKSNGSVLAQAIDEYAAPFVWLTVNFLVFKPKRGVELTAYVNLQTESHIGLVCFNLFTVSIPRDRLPSSWSWIWDEDGIVNTNDEDAVSSNLGNRRYEGGGQGHWVDANGVAVPDELTFRVLGVETSPWSESEKTYINIRGSLLDEAGDKAVDENRRQQREKRRTTKETTRGTSSGASWNTASNGASRR